MSLNFEALQNKPYLGIKLACVTVCLSPSPHCRAAALEAQGELEEGFNYVRLFRKHPLLTSSVNVDSFKLLQG